MLLYLCVGNLGRLLGLEQTHSYYLRSRAFCFWLGFIYVGVVGFLCQYNPYVGVVGLALDVA